MNDVVVTGMGAIAPNGNNVDSFWESIINGKDGYSESYKYLDQDFPFKVAGKICDFNPEEYLTVDEIESFDRAAQLGISAASMALEASTLKRDDMNREDVAVVMGTTCGSNSSIEEKDFLEKWYGKQMHVAGFENLRKYNHASIPNSISKKFSLLGPSYLVGTACAAGTHAIGEGFDLIRLGKAKVALCGGAESLSLLPIYGFHAIKSLSEDKCTPFNKNRKGMIISEGAGVLVLESLEHALQRNAKIYARVVGWAMNCDARNIASPLLDGSRCAELIERCLKNAEMRAEEIDYISLHGTGTETNDLMEVNGIKQVFREVIDKVYVSSIKSMIGHTLGAAGALEGIVSVYSIVNNQVPPNIYLEQPDDGFDVRFVTEPNQHHTVNNVLSVSFAFGGCNVGIIFSSFS